MSMTPFASTFAGVLAFAGALTSQVLVPHAPVPQPPPSPPHALPLIPPPIDHPAWLGQPGMHASAATDPTPSPASAREPNDPAGEPDPAEKLAQEFLQKRVAGKDLKLSVERVLKDLDWHENLADARAAAAARGRPLLWIQALGEIDGFA